MLVALSYSRYMKRSYLGDFGFDWHSSFRRMPKSNALKAMDNTLRAFVRHAPE